jgi:hypothetical protein
MVPYRVSAIRFTISGRLILLITKAKAALGRLLLRTGYLKYRELM